jgi:hypothetical protein
MEFTTIRVSEPVADELARRKGRGESYDDVVRSLLGMREVDRQEATGAARHPPRDDPPASPPTDPPTATDDESESEEEHEIDGAVWATVDDITSGWEDDHRLENRRRAAAAVLQYAVDTGEPVGKSSEIFAEVQESYPVNGQNEETYWRQNIRKVLSEVGEYSNATGGYTVDFDDLEADDGGLYDPTEEFADE